MPAPERTSWILPGLIVVAAFAYGLQLRDQGLVILEEGVILAEAEEIRRGRVLYRDIPEPVSPGVWYLTALTLEVAGPDLGPTRTLMVVVFALTTGVVFLICRSVASTGYAIAGVVFLCVQRVLAFPLGTFVFYTEFAIFFTLLGVLTLLRSADGTRRSWLGVAGLCLGLCALFKQNIGGALWLGAAVFALTRPRRLATLAWLFGPAALLPLLVAIYFASTGAFGAMLHQLVIEPFTGFYPTDRIPYFSAFCPSKDADRLFSFVPGLFTEEFLLSPGAASRPLVRVVEGASMLLYLTPVLIFVALGVRATRQGRLTGEELALAAGAFATFFGAFPRSDFVHLVQALVGFVPLAAYLAYRSRRASAVRIAGVAALGALSIFAAVLLWNLPYERRFEHPRARVDLSPAVHAAVVVILDALERHVPPLQSVAILPAGGMWYFLSGRPVPYGHALVLPYNQSQDAGRRFVESLERTDVRYVVLMESRMPGIGELHEYAPIIDAYLSEHFEEYASAKPGRMRFLRRRVGSALTAPPPDL